MKWIGLSVVAISASAFGDAAVPPPRAGATHGGDGKPAWVGQCAERLERARDEAALRVSVLKGARVETTAKERGAPGDPTSKQTVDSVQLFLFLGGGPTINAALEPDPMARNANLPWAPGPILGGPSGIRVDHGFAASYYLHDIGMKPRDEAAVAEILRRALDDCLRRAK
jgi:hypothetical protein